MRKYYPLIIVGIVIGIVSAWIITAVSKTVSQPDAALLQPVKTDRATLSDRNIETAQTAIKNQPGEPKGYNLLAAAFIQKSRETGDFSFNARAEEALKYSLKAAPDNYEAIKLNAAVLLNYHRFADALQESERALAMNPRDHEVYGAMVDALVELGNYDRAVETAQKMVDLRPDTASYSRISYLRSLHGDTQGAVDAMKSAIEAAPPQNPETGAWCRVHLGDELLKLGKLDEAEREYDHALYSFPDYHLALAAKARARFAAGDTDNAVTYFKRAIDRVPLPNYIIELGDLYAKLGQQDEAKQQYDQVEFIEKMGTYGGTFSRELALFWADHDVHLDEALAAAQRERAARNDIYTCDILAWCLYKKGRLDEAKKSMDEAMRLETDDPRLLYHTGVLATASGDNQKGAADLKQALATNQYFDIFLADKVKEQLNTLKTK